MTEPVCEVMQMPKAWCDHCRTPAPVKPMRDLLAPERPKRGPGISAMYPGTCAICQDRFDGAGQLLAFSLAVCQGAGKLEVGRHRMDGIHSPVLTEIVT